MLTSQAISDGYIWLSGGEKSERDREGERKRAGLRVHNCYTRPHPEPAGCSMLRPLCLCPITATAVVVVVVVFAHPARSLSMLALSLFLFPSLSLCVSSTAPLITEIA